MRLPEVGRYYYRGETTSLPVEEGHPWRAAWERFAGIHGGLGPEVTRLLTADPADRRTLPALGRLLRIYGAKLTTRSYLDSLQWLPEGLREIIAIHTLNAGVAPTRTPALYASMPAIMAVDGVFVPEGGVYEIVLSLPARPARRGRGQDRRGCARDRARQGRDGGGRVQVREGGERPRLRQAAELAGPRKRAREGVAVLLRGGRVRDAPGRVASRGRGAQRRVAFRPL